MASASSKAIPFVAMAIGTVLAVLSALGYEVPVLELMPLLAAMGLGGIPKSLIEKGLLTKATMSPSVLEALRQLGVVVPTNGGAQTVK